MSEWSSRPRTTPMAGHRGATSTYCMRCRDWHDTHRGPNPEACPMEEADRIMGEAKPATKAPAFIPKERLGTMPRKRVEVPFKLT